MTNDKTALDALDRLENDALSGRDGYGDARKDAEIIRNFINTRPQPSVDAVQVWVVYKVEDDSHHIFSTKENAGRFSQETTEPTVIYDYIIDHPERYYERTS